MSLAVLYILALTGAAIVVFELILRAQRSPEKEGPKSIPLSSFPAPKTTERVEPLHDDVSRMFEYIGFSSGKGCYADEISVGDLNRQYAKRSEPRLVADFLHHYAVKHPELIEECTRYSEELPSETILYRLKGYDAVPSSARIVELLRAMT